MTQRPLITILFAFAGGILISRVLPPAPDGTLLIAALLAAFSVMGSLFYSRQKRVYAFLFAFLLLGTITERQHLPASSLAPLAAGRQSVILQGSVLEPPRRVGEHKARFKILVHRLFLNDEEHVINEKILVNIYRHAPALSCGEEVRFPARLGSFRNFNNPGGYDYESAMRFKGFTCRASVSDGRHIVPMGQGRLPFPYNRSEALQRPVRIFLKKELDPVHCALFRALILGERQGISPELRERFNQTGLGHVLAVSGLHIGLIAGVAFFLFKWGLSRSYRLGLAMDTRKIAAGLTLLPVVGYTLMAGFHISSQRAMIMVSAFLFSLMLDREKEVWSTLALAALLILAIDPHALFSVSFQLSFAAVVGILCLVPRILHNVPEHLNKKRRLHRFLLYLAGLAAVSLAAATFLLPITAYYFHRVSLVTVPANITVVPLLGLWVLPLGLFSTLVLPFSSGLAAWFLQLSAAGLDGIMSMIEFWADLPGSSTWMFRPNSYEIFLFYALVFFILIAKRSRWARIGLVLAVFVSASDVVYWIHRNHFNNDIRITFLDVGQANSALVEFPRGKTMLIDGGGFPGGQFDVGRFVVAPFLWYSKILHIDYLVLSHPQSDHMNGLRFVAGAFHPQEFWYNGDTVDTPAFAELMKIIESQNIRTLLPSDLAPGRDINGVKVEVLYPTPHAGHGNPEQRSTDLNNNSLVLRIQLAGRSVLFPGDLESQGEGILVERRRGSLQSDVLLSPHHGSSTSSTTGFLQAVRPRVCVISSGEGNRFGFPHRQTLKRLKAVDCRTIRIDRSGAVSCKIDADRIRIQTFLGEDRLNLN